VDDCTKAYPVLQKRRAGELPLAFSLALVYSAEIQRRLQHFIDRHGMSERFEQEDSAGKR